MRCRCGTYFDPDCQANHRDDHDECRRCGGMCTSRRQCDELLADAEARIAARTSRGAA